MMATSKGLLVIVCWILMTNGGAVCPDGYCRHSDGCYRTVALNVTWIDARSYCEVLGGALLSPVSQSMAAAAEGALRRMKDGAVCPDGYCRHSDGCYRTVALNVTWIDARSYCEVLGGHLLSPVSQSMAAAAEGALRRMKETDSGKFWIDITDLDKKALNFTNWDTTSGNGTSEEGARNGVYMSESLDYRWVPASCTETINFLCYHVG
ncbi:hypothetical protein DPMN_099186 [Dreissena polymorpha]|uniref:C-type lectin domain-containing protein n=1 Tax=Dreissena polymorpha TaxID=45954 RepID=A0A9D4LF11_DREPO|nr:hypothetical protein DPMN_099186 [Dreissena polymorpha]